MPYFNRVQDRHSIVDPGAIAYQSFYISDPPAVPDSLLYQLNRAGTLPNFPPSFLIRRDEEYPFTALICVTAGKGSLTMGDSQFFVQAGQSLVVPPYTAYEYRSDPDDPFSLVWAEFCGGDSQRFVRYLLAHNGPVLPRQVTEPLMEICLSLIHPPQADRMTWISHRLYETMLLLWDACRSTDLRPRKDLYQILDYINLHLGETLTLKSMSEAFGYSPAYFSRFFLQHAGIHFSQYLLRQRVERGRQLLLSTDLPIDQLAHQLGFCDASHFVRTFREAVGESPACFRRNHLG